ncbi:MAG: cation transporter [Lachnospiraceae bacterium]|nr:cation transporter [Lachnospiraceae bacterium]
MISLLAKVFIKEEGEITNQVRKAYGSLCSIVGICLNVLLFGIKYFAGTMSGSIAITADAFNNLSDAGSSFITLVGFWYAGKKPDLEHPFGHGRFEYVSGFVVSMAILLMGAELARTSVEKIIHPQSIDTGNLAMAILVISIAVKVYMAFYNKKIGKKIGSAAMEATSMDSLSDTVATTVVLIAMVVMRYTGVNIDGICGVLVAIFILYAGYNAARETISPLLGKVPETEFVEQVEQIVMSHEGIIGTHDLIVHDYGPGRVMISLHAEVPGNGNIYELHDKIDLIERELKEKLGCEAVIHMDPIEVDNELVKTVRKQVEEQLKNVEETLTIHDFRMVTGPTHTNLIFDIVVPYNIKFTDEEVEKQVQEQLQQLNSSYIAVINIDKAYVK